MSGSWVFINWACDFCGKTMLTVSAAGIIYCTNCSMSYGTRVRLT